jgi:hypothetical protein
MATPSGSQDEAVQSVSQKGTKMSAEITIERPAELSPRWVGRLAGLLYLISGQAYSFAELSVLGKNVAPGDAAATAHNILAHETLFRMAFAAELVETILFIAVTLLFYRIFKPVNRSVALLATFFSLTGCTVYAVGSILHLAPLLVLGGASYLNVFKAEQLQALALLFLNLRTQATNIYMVFFGCYNLLLGYLIVYSKFLPRILGIFIGIAGLAYQTYLSPPLAEHLFRYLVGPAGALGELSLMLWLIVFGVNVQRWKEQASAAEERRIA